MFRWLVLLVAASWAGVVNATSPAHAVSLAFADAKKLDATLLPGEIENFRYFWIPRDTVKTRRDLRMAFQLHAYLLSHDSLLERPPTLVGPRLIRIDARDYVLNLKVLEKAKNVDVFFHTQIIKKTKSKLPGLRKAIKQAAAAPWLGHPDLVRAANVARAAGFYEQGDLIETSEIRGLIELLNTEVPILNAEWFIVQSMRQISIRNTFDGIGYYDFHGIKNRDDFFRLAGFRKKDADRLFKVWRAVLPKSGVSQQNRQVVGYSATTGRLWLTLDTFTEKDRGIAIRNLRDGEFDHDAEEAYVPLPNGLPLTALFAAKDNAAQGIKAGDAQESAPDKIGPDDSPFRVGRDARIHVNIACMRCHAEKVLQPIKCGVRQLYKQNGSIKKTLVRLRLQSVDKKILLELTRQYFSDLDYVLQRDREDYQRAFQLATITPWEPKGLTTKAAVALYAGLWNTYVEERVSASKAARELGTTEDHFLASLKQSLKLTGELDPVLAGLIAPEVILPSRLQWEDVYALAQTIIRGYKP